MPPRTRLDPLPQLPPADALVPDRPDTPTKTRRVVRGVRKLAKSALHDLPRARAEYAAADPATKAEAERRVEEMLAALNEVFPEIGDDGIVH